MPEQPTSERGKYRSAYPPQLYSFFSGLSIITNHRSFALIAFPLGLRYKTTEAPLNAVISLVSYCSY